MNKKDKIDIIISKIREQVEDLLDNEGTEEMTAQEILVLATEIVTSNVVTSVNYTAPMGKVYRQGVSFMLDDEFDIPLYSEEEDGED